MKEEVTTMTDIIRQIDKEIEDTIVMDDYDGGYVSGLRVAKKILLSAQEDGPRYFGYKSNADTPLN